LTTAEAEALANHWRDVAKGIPPNVIALPVARKKSEALDTIQPPLEPSWSSEKPSLQSPPNDKTAQEQLKATGRLKDSQVSTYLKAFLDGDPLPFKLGDITDNDQLYRFIEAWTRNRTQISISLLQRVFNVGYVRASEFVSRLEKAGLVGEDPGGGKQRPVLLQHQEDAVDAGDILPPPKGRRASSHR
jgi:DNA segregation ATPase FtsK/SpoIIIE-like protein